MRNNFKTLVLMAVLGALFVLVGQLVGGTNGALVALAIAGGINFLMYFFSDKIALASARAKPVEESDLPEVYSIVRSLTQRENLPMPRIYLIPSAQPNAFATGRNPRHAAVAVTSGIMQMMDRDELEGVLAHEMSHVRNRDVLIATIAATVAAALSFLMRMALWGGLRGNDRRQSDPFTLILGLVSIILAPLAAMIIQLAISRSREFEADHSGAVMTGSPMALARALEKLEAGTSRVAMPMNPSTAQLFIADPLKALRRSSTGGGGGMGGLGRLFSTHPPIPERVQRLTDMAQGIR